MDVLALIQAAPNIAFGLIAIWFLQAIQKERAIENTRYATSLEKINELYIALLERAVTAIAHNAAVSSANGESIAKLAADFVAIRAEVGRRLDAIERLIRDSAKRGASNSGGSQGGAA